MPLGEIFASHISLTKRLYEMMKELLKVDNPKQFNHKCRN